jgi:hypothetical protein
MQRTLSEYIEYLEQKIGTLKKQLQDRSTSPGLYNVRQSH